MYVKESGSWTVNYIGRDYLGSITHVIDATGVVRQELSYDPWGRLRDPLTQALFEFDKRLTLVLGDRGYTGHEHLQEFGLINMNARLYDPVVGRFLSPDPYVQAPDFSQNFNRYSYALNNPLRYTDPNGEFIIPLIILAGGFLTGYVGHGISSGNWGFQAFIAGWMGMVMSATTMGGASALATVGQALGSVGSDMGAVLLGNIVKPIELSIGKDFGMSLSPTALLTWRTSYSPKFNYGAMLSARVGSITVSGGLSNISKSYGVSFDNGTFGFGYGRTHYTDYRQRTGTISARYKDFSLRWENDVNSTGGDGNDRFRSNATEIGYKNYFIGTNVFTNNPKDEPGYSNDFLNDEGKPGARNYVGDVNGSKLFKENKNGTYNRGYKFSSPLYFGMKKGNQITRIGLNDPLFGDFSQNGFHQLIGSPNLHQGNYGTNGYFQRGTYMPFTLY